MRWRNREKQFIHSLVGRFAAGILLLGLRGTVCKAQDFQSCNEIDLTASWKGVDFLLPLLARTDLRLQNPQLEATGITADFHLPCHLTLTGGYVFAVVPQPLLDIHLPLVAITSTFHFHGFALADRNRFEQLVGFRSSPVRYRNRFLADHAFGAQERWHAFADDEVLVNLTDWNWNQNRLQLGGGTRLTPRPFLDIYYLRRNLRGDLPTQNVLGTTLRINLRPRKEAFNGSDDS
jgi:Protein of unknown function (DUF2490)